MYKVGPHLTWNFKRFRGYRELWVTQLVISGCFSVVSYLFLVCVDREYSCYEVLKFVHCGVAVNKVSITCKKIVGSRPGGEPNPASGVKLVYWYPVPFPVFAVSTCRCSCCGNLAALQPSSCWCYTVIIFNAFGFPGAASRLVMLLFGILPKW